MERFHLALEITQCNQAAEKAENPRSHNSRRFNKNNINSIHRNHIKRTNDIQIFLQNKARNNKSCPQMGFARLKELTTKDPSEVVLTLSNPNSGFKKLLNESSIGKDMMEYILIVLAESTKAAELRSLASLINTVVTDSPFISQHLQRYMVSLKTFSLFEFNHMNVLTNAIVFLLKFQEMQPATSSEVLSFVLPVLNDTLERLQKKGLDVPLSIRSKLQCLEERKETILQRYDQRTRSRISCNEKFQAEDPPENYRTISIFPTKKDFSKTRPFIRPNIVEGSYFDADHYLDVQFRLLREDFIRPLRERVQSYKNATDAPRKIGVYRNIHILCPYNSEGRLVYLISFDAKPFAHIRWEVSKRFLPGSLLCLSLDNFKTMKFATVASREPEELKKGKLEVEFEQLDDEMFSISPSTPFVMVESEAYFEAFRHTLGALQQITEFELPLKEYIIHAEKEVKIPQYLNQDTEYNFSTTFHNLPKKYAAVPVLSADYWPSSEELNLDQSQYSALKAALTKAFVVIQGPPGTGKTFVGLKITQMLLENSGKWTGGIRTPILVVCYTNHALDQFLQGITAFTEDVVRIGGRCSNDQIGQFKLNNLRKKARENREIPEYIYLERCDIMLHIRTIEEYLEQCMGDVEKSTEQIPPLIFLSPFMRESHEDCFQVESQNVSQFRSDIDEWLGVSHLSHLEKRGEEERDDADLERDIGEGEDEHGNKRKQTTNMADQENHGWNEVKSTAESRRMKQFIRKQLKSQEIMAELEANHIENVWELKIGKRWSLYRLWLSKYVSHLFKRISDLQKCYHQYSEELKKLTKEENKYLLRRAKVIGMTTTGAGKYREFLQDLQPRIVIVEEAAEVLEAHIVTSLSQNTQHLILIGDHQQLRPSPTVYELAIRYSLDISLFERVINNGMPFHQLNLQHRMRPCIAKLLTPHIYPNLENHSSVERYENILGVGTNMFFINHSEHESDVVDRKSQSNLHEAEFLFQFCKFLRYQGYKSSQLTVLTTYSGQLFALKHLMKRERILEGIRVTVVDNYQGEENDIILISFVRSNDKGSIGFLKVSNRLCVALSRARKGLYCIGNFELFSEESCLWRNITQELQQQSAIGLSLPLFCQNHPKIISKVSKAKDFTKYVPDGGCNKPCNLRMKCGHVCIKSCHPYDMAHTDVACLKSCTKVLCSLGHVCPKFCYETCGHCNVLIEKVIPKCKHNVLVPCHLNPYEFNCLEKCENVLDCGHNCSKPCYQVCSPCTNVVVKTFECEHSVDIACYKVNDINVCPEPCKENFACGHSCTAMCGVKPCSPCSTIVGKSLNCGHIIAVKCSFYSFTVFACKKSCRKAMKCKHRCKLTCGHKGDCSPCKKPCGRRLSCTHPCPLRCSDECPKMCELCNLFPFDDVISENEIFKRLTSHYLKRNRYKKTGKTKYSFF